MMAGLGLAQSADPAVLPAAITDPSVIVRVREMNRVGLGGPAMLEARQAAA